MSEADKPQTPAPQPLDLEARPVSRQTGLKQFGKAARAKKVGRAKPPMAPWEIQEAVRWLALTGNCAEVSRILHRPPRTIWNVANSPEHRDEIQRLRVELLMGLKDEFDASLRLTHQRYREFLLSIRDLQHLAKYGHTLVTLAEVIGLITDRRAMIMGDPSKVLSSKDDLALVNDDQKWFDETVDEAVEAKLKARIAEVNERNQQGAGEAPGETR